jgi:hypothetical protein
VTEARLLGGLDLAATLRAGRPLSERGLLSECDGGVAVLAMAERAARSTVAQIAAALDNGEVLLEGAGGLQVLGEGGAGLGGGGELGEGAAGGGGDLCAGMPSKRAKAVGGLAGAEAGQGVDRIDIAVFGQSAEQRNIGAGTQGGRTANRGLILEGLVRANEGHVQPVVVGTGLR